MWDHQDEPGKWYSEILHLLKNGIKSTHLGNNENDFEARKCRPIFIKTKKNNGLVRPNGRKWKDLKALHMARGAINKLSRSNRGERVCRRTKTDRARTFCDMID